MRSNEFNGISIAAKSKALFSVLGGSLSKFKENCKKKMDKTKLTKNSEVSNATKEFLESYDLQLEKIDQKIAIIEETKIDEFGAKEQIALLEKRKKLIEDSKERIQSSKFYQMIICLRVKYHRARGLDTEFDDVREAREAKEKLESSKIESHERAEQQIERPADDEEKKSSFKESLREIAQGSADYELPKGEYGSTPENSYSLNETKYIDATVPVQTEKKEKNSIELEFINAINTYPLPEGYKSLLPFDVVKAIIKENSDFDLSIEEKMAIIKYVDFLTCETYDSEKNNDWEGNLPKLPICFENFRDKVYTYLDSRNKALELPGRVEQEVSRPTNLNYHLNHSKDSEVINEITKESINTESVTPKVIELPGEIQKEYLTPLEDVEITSLNVDITPEVKVSSPYTFKADFEYQNSMELNQNSVKSSKIVILELDAKIKMVKEKLKNLIKNHNSKSNDLEQEMITADDSRASIIISEFQAMAINKSMIYDKANEEIRILTNEKNALLEEISLRNNQEFHLTRLNSLYRNLEIIELEFAKLNSDPRPNTELKKELESAKNKIEAELAYIKNLDSDSLESELLLVEEKLKSASSEDEISNLNFKKRQLEAIQAYNTLNGNSNGKTK